MKKILITALSIVFYNSFFSQCADLYIEEHLAGDPICLLGNGDVLTICLDDNTVSGGSCDLYIINKSSLNGSLVYDLALDNVYYAQTYATLMINPTTKRLGFIVGSSNSAYSYRNE